MNWQGSVLAAETGEYEFVVKSENAIKLWVNDTVRPLIDASVKSGDDTEYRGSIHLLGGRVYPLRLEFSRGKEKRSSISLLWKPPHRTVEVIPGRNLSPERIPGDLRVEDAVPARRPQRRLRARDVDLEGVGPGDDRRGARCGRVRRGASQGSGRGIGRHPDKEREPKLRDFCGRFAERAFRRPMSAEQRAFFVDRQFKASRDPATAVKRVVLLALKSPRFLYRELGAGNPDAFDVASRLSFGLWDSLPDATLLEAAASGRLANREQVADQARRMAADLAPLQAPRVLPPMAAGRSGARDRQGSQGVSRLR